MGLMVYAGQVVIMVLRFLCRGVGVCFFVGFTFSLGFGMGLGLRGWVLIESICAND